MAKKRKKERRVAEVADTALILRDLRSVGIWLLLSVLLTAGLAWAIQLLA